MNEKSPALEKRRGRDRGNPCHGFITQKEGAVAEGQGRARVAVQTATMGQPKRVLIADRHQDDAKGEDEPDGRPERVQPRALNAENTSPERQLPTLKHYAR